MAIAATIQGAPLATPTQLATQPALGQAAVTTSVRITRQALTANGEAQFQPQQLPSKAEQASPHNGPVRFNPQGGGGAAAAVSANPTQQQTAAPSANLPVPVAANTSAAPYTLGTTAFLAQLFGQAGGVLQGNGLALFGAISNAVATAKAAQAKPVKAETPNQQQQELRDMRVALGLGSRNVNAAQQVAKQSPVAAAQTPAPTEPPRPPLPAKRNLARIQEGNKLYRAAQIFSRPTSFASLPEGTPRTAVS